MGAIVILVIQVDYLQGVKLEIILWILNIHIICIKIKLVVYIFFLIYPLIVMNVRPSAKNIGQWRKRPHPWAHRACSLKGTLRKRWVLREHIPRMCDFIWWRRKSIPEEMDFKARNKRHLIMGRSIRGSIIFEILCRKSFFLNPFFKNIIWQEHRKRKNK